MIAGVYKIVNNITNDIYVGSTKNFSKRWIGHRSRLKTGKRCNKKLKNAWDKYKPENFTFEKIEFVEDSSKLMEREQYWIDTLKPKYNISLSANSVTPAMRSEEFKKMVSAMSKGNQHAKGNTFKMTPEQISYRRSRRVYTKHTPESIEKMRISHSKRPPITEETRAKLVQKKRELPSARRIADIKEPVRNAFGQNHFKTKLTDILVLEIRELFKSGLSAPKIGELYSIHSSTVYNVVYRYTWKHI